MNGALDILKRERDDASEQIRMLRARIRDLEAAIAILEGQPTPIRSGRAAANIKQGVLSLLSESGENGATPKELTEALTGLGHDKTSEPSISSTLSRLKAEAKVTNRGGRWFAANPNQAHNSSGTQETPSSHWGDLDDDVPF